MTDFNFPNRTTEEQLELEQEFPLPTTEEQRAIIDFIRECVRLAKRPFPERVLLDEALPYVVNKHLDTRLDPVGKRIPNIDTWFAAIYFRGARHPENANHNLYVILCGIYDLLNRIRSGEITKEDFAKEVEEYLLEIDKSEVGAQLIDRRVIITSTDTYIESDVFPKKYLLSWAEITAAVGLTNDTTMRKRIRGMHDQYPSPIDFGNNKGCQPKVEKSILISWWNSIEERFQESAQKKINRQSTVAETHPHGRTGEVVPEIRGSVRKRKR